MQYNYAYWSEKDARAGLYTVNSKVAYKSLDGVERVFQANEDYVGSILPPDNDDTWDFVEDIVYDWDAKMKYKIGSVVNYNRIQYVATKRYRGGSAPPNEELDPDGIRTWMLNYEDGPEPVTPFFYKKLFGYKDALEANPYSNFLEDIDFLTMPYFFEDEFGNPVEPQVLNDRFSSQRNNLTWLDGNSIDRRPEQALANSVMEAHPYHDIYVTGVTRYFNQKPYFDWFPNAKHKSEMDDKLLYPYISYRQNTNFFIPKRTIPYWNNYLAYVLDAGSISQLTNGVSLEYYPDSKAEDIEIICPKYTRNLSVFEGPYLSSLYSGPYSTEKITPLYISHNRAELSVDPVSGERYENTKMRIIVHPNNICVDSVKITLYFVMRKTICWVSGYTQSGQAITECAEPEYTYFQLTYDYNENTRVASRDYSDTFKGKSFKWVDNPAYDPSCVPDYSVEPPITCPQPLMPIEDTLYPDTSIDFSSYLEISGGNSAIGLIGWSIS